MNPHTASDSGARASAKVKDEVRKRGKNVGTPEGAMVFPRIVNFPERLLDRIFLETCFNHE